MSLPKEDLLEIKSKLEVAMDFLDYADEILVGRDYHPLYDGEPTTPDRQHIATTIALTQSQLKGLTGYLNNLHAILEDLGGE